MKVAESVEKKRAGRTKKSKQGSRRINRYSSQGENVGKVVVEDITERHTLGGIEEDLLFLEF